VEKGCPKQVPAVNMWEWMLVVKGYSAVMEKVRLSPVVEGDF
jgi:hypothetical protein